MKFADWVVVASGIYGVVLFTLGLIDALRRRRGR